MSSLLLALANVPNEKSHTANTQILCCKCAQQVPKFYMLMQIKKGIMPVEHALSLTSMQSSGRASRDKRTSSGSLTAASAGRPTAPCRPSAAG